MTTTSFADAFTRHVASATARQLALADVLEDRPWAVDINAGTATFGELTFPIQLLGTEAEGDNSWLWAWANDASSLPEAILRSSRELRAVGQAEGPELLATRSSSLSDWSGHQIAMVCTGILDTGPYYRGPYDGGALYFTIESIQLPTADGPRISTVLMQVISSFEVDHRAVTLALFKDIGFNVQHSLNGLVAKGHGGSVHVEFDRNGRISNMELHL